MSLLLTLLFSAPIPLTLHEDGLHPNAGGDTRPIAQMSSDAFITVRAPSGHVRRGQEFTAEGQLDYQTSAAGYISGTIKVGPCSSHFLHYHPDARVGSHTATVTCTVHEGDMIDTRLDACIDDQRCASDTAMVSVN